MGWLIPWIAIAISLAAVLGRGALRSGPSNSAPVQDAEKLPVGLLISVAALSALAGLIPGLHLAEFSRSFVGAAFGIILALGIRASETLSFDERIGRIIAAGLATAALGWADIGATGAKEAYPGLLGLVLGAGIGSLWLRGSSKGQAGEPGLAFAVFMATGAFANLLGMTGKTAQAGTMLMFVATLAFLLETLFASNLKSVAQAWFRVAAIGLLVSGAWVLARRFFFLSDLGWVATGSALVALVVSWRLSGVNSNASEFLIASILWVALATVAFGLLKGFGIAVAALSGTACLVAYGSRAGVLSIAPLLALSGYRTFRVLHPDSSRAFDIGQHYALIGLLLGLLLALGLLEWTRSSRTGARGLASNLFAALLIGTALCGGLILLGTRGSVGMLFGFGFLPVLAGLKGERAWTSVVPALALSAFLTLVFGPLGPELSLERSEKLRLLAILAGCGLVFGSCASILGHKRRDSGSAEAAA